MKTDEIEKCLKKSVLLDMAFERHNSYLCSLKALAYFFYDGKNDKVSDQAADANLSAHYLGHLISLMDQELQTISDLHSSQREIISQYALSFREEMIPADPEDQKQSAGQARRSPAPPPDWRE